MPIGICSPRACFYTALPPGLLQLADVKPGGLGCCARVHWECKISGFPRDIEEPDGIYRAFGADLSLDACSVIAQTQD